MHVIFLATGNNLQYVGDLARRVVPIALDPKMEKPEERAGFKYPDLLAHIAQERPRLVSAALTILKAYFADGCPSQGLSAYGSFQPWSDLIRSALVWTGEEDPCEGRKTIEAQDRGSRSTDRKMYGKGSLWYVLTVYFPLVAAHLHLFVLEAFSLSASTAVIPPLLRGIVAPRPG
jgi:hypothetical protein